MLTAHRQDQSMGFRQSFHELRDVIDTARAVFDTTFHHSVRRCVAFGADIDVPAPAVSSQHTALQHIATTVDTHYDEKIDLWLEARYRTQRILTELRGVEQEPVSYHKKKHADLTGSIMQRILYLMLTDEEWFVSDQYANKGQADRMTVAMHELTSKRQGGTVDISRTLAEMLTHYSSTVIAMWFHTHDRLFPLMNHVIRAWEHDERLSSRGTSKDHYDTIRMVMLVLMSTFMQHIQSNDVPWDWQEHVLVTQATNPDLIHDAWQDARNIVLHTAPIRDIFGRLHMTPWWLQW